MSIHPTEENRKQLHSVPAVERVNLVDTNAQEIQFSELIGTIIDSWRLIAGITLLLLLMGLVYVVLSKPVYRADVLLQVEEKSKGIGALEELSDLLQEEAPVSAEFEIIRSRMVIGAVVDNLKLDIVARPVRFPLVGTLFAPKDERIRIESFDVPSDYQGQVFTLVAGSNGRYRLFEPEGKMLIQGVVGNPVNVSLVEGETIKLFVSELKSKAGAEFELIRKARLSAIDQLKASLKITEQGKQSGILQMSLEGQNRKKITDILNEIANIYLRQSVERKSAEAGKTLQFLEKQLPKLREKVENAEAALNNYRLKKGSVDLPLETRATLDKMVSIDAQLTQIRRERDELIRRFTPEHPRITSLDAQIDTLNMENSRVNSKVKGLPGTQQEVLRLTRDMEVNASLYTALMNSAQELKVVKAGAVGNVRIVDYAVMPNKPVKPKKGFVVALTFVLGALLGVGAAFIRKSLRGAVQDPDLIEKKLGLPVYATVPYSRKQRELNKGGKLEAVNPAVLAAVNTEDLAVESLRSLRTSLYFAKLNAKNNVLSITSPGPGAGKTFVGVNLGAVLAGADKRVLVIDADLRKGRVHHLFGMARGMGLSDVIASDLELARVIRKTEINNLDIIPAGTIPPNPSELLLHKKFGMILAAVSANYEHVIIDSPPVLAVTDAAIIGRLAGATLLIVKDGQSPLREIEQSVKQLKQASVNLRGAVYNGMKPSSSRYGYGKYYGYNYSYKKKL